jgi:hypothetical protein
VGRVEIYAQPPRLLVPNKKNTATPANIASIPPKTNSVSPEPLFQLSIKIPQTLITAVINKQAVRKAVGCFVLYDAYAALAVVFA